MSDLRKVEVYLRPGYPAEDFVKRLAAYGAKNVEKVNDSQVTFDIYFLKTAITKDLVEVDSFVVHSHPFFDPEVKEIVESFNEELIEQVAQGKSFDIQITPERVEDIKEPVVELKIHPQSQNSLDRFKSKIP